MRKKLSKVLRACKYSSAYRYVVPSFVFKGEKSGLVFFGHEQKSACVLVQYTICSGGLCLLQPHVSFASGCLNFVWYHTKSPWPERMASSL
jgi:hypothetical protein